MNRDDKLVWGRRTGLVALVVLALAACSTRSRDLTDDETNAGGSASASGGKSSNGGTAAKGGSSAKSSSASDDDDDDDDSASGGSTAGGNASSGGAAASGGDSASGGGTTDGSGGNASSGGETANGGSTTAGGNQGNGGSGAEPSGGSPSEGGSSAEASGGVAPTGGTTSTSVTPIPSVSSLTPTTGIVTTTVSITGSDFGASQSTSTVTIGGISVTPTSWSNTEITFLVPTEIYPSLVSVVVTIDGNALTAGTFDVTLPRTVYVNQDDYSTENAVAAYSLGSDGSLTELSGSPYSTSAAATEWGGDATSIAVHRGTRRLFATNYSSTAVFDIDPVSGALTAVSGSPFGLDNVGGAGIVVNDAGNRVYVANCWGATDADGDGNTDDANVSAYNVATNGVLTQVSGSPVATLDNLYPDTPQLLHNDQLLTVTGNDVLSVFSVDSSSGALTAVTGSPFSLSSSNWTSRRDPTGTYLYVHNTNDKTIQVYSFGSDGTPTALSGSPFATSASANYLQGFAFTPDGSYLYVGNFGYPEILTFSVSNGVLTESSSSPIAVLNASAISSLAVTRDGQYLVATDEVDAELSVFQIYSDGSLNPVTLAPVSAPSIYSASGIAIGE